MSEKKPRHNTPASESVPVTVPVSVEDWVDVMVAIRHQMVHYPGDRVELRQAKHLDRAEPATVDHLYLGVNTGTHVDAPVHLLEAEKHDPIAVKHIGNFPQGFSHLALICKAGVIENGEIQRCPQARHSRTDSEDRYRNRRPEMG